MIKLPVRTMTLIYVSYKILQLVKFSTNYYYVISRTSNEEIEEISLCN